MNGGSAVSNSTAISQSGAVADATSASTATNGGSAVSQSTAVGLGSTPSCMRFAPCSSWTASSPARSVLSVHQGSADAQAQTVSQANGEGSQAISGSIAVSTQNGANALSVSQASNGAIANSQTLASDTAASNATGSGISVAGGCAIFVGCGFALAQTNVNPLGPDTSSSFAVAATNASSETGGIGAVAEASAAGNGGPDQSSSNIVPGVGRQLLLLIQHG